MSLQFEWDPKKAEANLAKHSISFEEAITVFADPLARIFNDEEHSGAERREIIIGHSNKNRLLVVSYTRRTFAIIRIISARRAIQKEWKEYEEK